MINNVEKISILVTTLLSFMIVSLGSYFLFNSLGIGLLTFGILLLLSQIIFISYLLRTRQETKEPKRR